MADVSTHRTGLISRRAYRLLWDGHSTAGVVFGLALFVIFYCGTLSLFRAEIMMWADPALSRATTPTSDADRVILPILESRPPEPATDVMVVYPFAGRPYYWLRYDEAGGGQVDTWVGAGTGELVPPRGRSRLSEILYKLHYFHQLGTPGRIASGIVAVFLGFGIITGLLIHLKKLPHRVHTFRPRSSLRTAMADAHTALGVLGLPFTLLYAVTGAFFSLLIVLLGPTVLLVFDGDQAALDSVLSGLQVSKPATSAVPAEMASPDQIARAVESEWGDFEPLRLDYFGWGRSGARAVVEGTLPETLVTSGKAVLDAESALMVRDVHPERPTSLGAVVAVMTNLHFASFGSALIDGLFFVLGLAASAVILSGNLLWLLARRSKDPRSTPWLHVALARLTVGIGVGLVATIPLVFVGSRMIPLDVAHRTDWEDVMFFGVWLVLAVSAFFGPSARWAARWQLAVAGVASFLVPISSGVFGGRWPWQGLSEGRTGVLAVDLGFLVSGLALGAFAAALARPADAGGVRAVLAKARGQRRERGSGRLRSRNTTTPGM